MIIASAFGRRHGLALCAYLLLCATVALGDDGITVTGTVVDEQGKEVAFASVALYHQKDSSLVTGAASDDKGAFIIPAKPGDYYLLVRFLSYKDRIISDVKVEKADLDLGRVVLQPAVTQLQTFTVEADRPQMEMKLDKRVFNVAQDMSNRGGTAADVLDNIPSVEVDVEGTVSLRGSENVRILIDGKPSALTGLSSTVALRMLQGDLVERVEVITNPSARYDAEGEVGIINIVLKKEKSKGINGSFEVRAGYPDNYGLSLSMNVKRKRVNFFTSYGTGYNDRPGGGTMNQAFFYPDTTYFYDRIQTRNRTNFSHNLRLGTDFQLTDHSSLTLSGSYNPSQGLNVSKNTYSDYDSTKTLTRTVERTEEENEDEERKEINLNFRRTFEKQDRLWTVDVQLDDSRENELADLTEINSDAGVPDIVQRTAQISHQQSTLWQSDYVHPLGEEGKFEAGIKVTTKELNYDYYLETRNSDLTWARSMEYDNTMIYTDNVYAAYVMAGNKTGKISYQGGLRYEQAELQTRFLQNNYSNTRLFPGLFPSAHFSYEINEDRSVQLSYSRRVSRPRHWWLMPFFGLSDSRNVFSGNPNINPEFTHSMEFGLLNQGDKGSLLSSVYYRRTDGKMERIIISDTVGITLMFPINLSVENSYGFEFSGSYQPKTWWNINGSFNFYRAISDGTYDGIRYYNDAYAWSSRLTSKWKIRKKFNCQTSLNYRSPSQTTQGNQKAMYNWDAGAALDLFKGNGTLTFNVNDILNSRRRRQESYSEYFSSVSDFQWRARTMTLSFSYRLNQKQREDRGKRGEGNYEGGDFDGGDM